MPRVRVCGEVATQGHSAGYACRSARLGWWVQEASDKMPAYFKFLTLLGFHVMIEDKVCIRTMMTR